MSYHIVYDRQFIRFGELYIPLVLSGDNNVYEARGRGNKRCRDWSSMILIAPHGMAKEYEMLDAIEKWRESIIKGNIEYRKDNPEHEEYSDKMFGWFASIQIGSGHTTTTTYGKMVGLVKTGCAKAVTIDKLMEYAGVPIVFCTQSSLINGELSTGWYVTATGKATFMASTEADLAVIQEKIGAIIAQNPEARFWVECNMNEDVAWLIRKFNFPRATPSKTAKDLDEWWVIQSMQGNTSGMFFQKRTSLRSRWAYSGRKFTSAKAAQKYADNYLSHIHTKIVRQVKAGSAFTY